MWNSVKIVKLVSILECFYSWTKTGGYIISELYKIWRVYRDDGRLSRELEVIFIVVGGCLSQLEVACNKGRYRAARAAKNDANKGETQVFRNCKKKSTRELTRVHTLSTQLKGHVFINRNRSITYPFGVHQFWRFWQFCILYMAVLYMYL